MTKNFKAHLEQKYEINSTSGEKISMRTVVIKDNKNKTLQTLQILNNPLEFEKKLQENSWKIIKQLDNEIYSIEKINNYTPEQQKLKNNKIAVASCCSILGLVFIIVFAFSLFSFSKHEPQPEGKSEISAEVYCEQAVKTQLIDTPSTAKFTDMKPVYSGEVKDEDNWVVLGHVEYDNEIGGRSGDDFRCTMKYTQVDDSWHGRAEWK